MAADTSLTTETLGALSLLARWVTEAEVIKTDDQSGRPR